ncbi:hypothetical protein ACHHRT_09005 [Desulfurivibrio sp. D14AmB]|uniref:hypothetical protein n=1 Tax=Desulfurivibrio sp. D14AmB TaxID=3374370 RepID=UPI00376F072B
MLIGWVPFTIFLFSTLKPHQAVLVSVIGGWLLLPVFSYNFQGIPTFDKHSAIALGLVLGGWLSGQRQKANFQWKIYDLPMVLWCFSAIPTSLVNQLGLYDGISGTFTKIMVWGIPYLAGRIYFTNHEALHDLCRGIVIGGLIYLPLCLYEIRMSPQLSNTIYGFFPHSFHQHARYGGYRPIVFMNHGLMVALWMAMATTVAFWLWRSRIVEQIKGIPMGFIVMALAITTLLCKTQNGILLMFLGCSLYYVYRYTKTSLPFTLLVLGIPAYLVLRITGVIEMDNVASVMAHLVDERRIPSLLARLTQEDNFIRHTLNSPLFGWGTHQRNWPIDPETGRRVVRAIDPLWLINFSINGFFGLLAFLGAMMLGPWKVLGAMTNPTEKAADSMVIPLALSSVVIMFMIDCIFNGMINPVYIVSTGALIGWFLTQENGKTKVLKVRNFGANTRRINQ